jgi:1-acyl-sn-glycerol-3-phosphate acyltransferase
MQTVPIDNLVPQGRPAGRVSLTARARRSLAVQAFLGRLAFSVVGPAAVFLMRWVRGNRIEGLAAARRAYQQAVATGRPTVVCANHLTMFDSAYLLHAFGSIFDYLADFRLFCWNVPAVENFTRSLFWRAVVYFGKCVPIDRGGDAAHHRSVLDSLAYLVTKRDVCMIFPEGGRSRTGRVEVERVTYGVGRILSALDRPQVVCAYLRGERQATYGGAPARGDVLHLHVEVIEPTTSHRGMRGVRDLARQVIVRLRAMEDSFFEACPRAASAPPPGPELDASAP